MATILVVEDENSLRELMCMILREQHTVLEASNGADAFRLFEASHPDLIITDLSMPKMSGFQLIQQVRSSNSKVKILAISALLNIPEEKEILLRAGANACLGKPISIGVLIHQPITAYSMVSHGTASTHA